MNVLFVMRNGKRLSGGAINIIVKKRSDSEFSEAKVVVSQKVAKKAVARHKIQRWLREIMKRIFKENHEFSRGYDMVIIARPSASHASFRDLQKSVEDVFHNQHSMLNDSRL